MSRKYRQHGYQDIEEPPGSSRAGNADSRSDGPRGRGLGTPTKSSFKCARCGTAASGAIVTDTTCKQCGSDLHTCSNCRHFDTSVHNECRAPITERVAAKTKRNSCGKFESKVVKGFAQDSASNTEDPKAAFEALFDF